MNILQGKKRLAAGVIIAILMVLNTPIVACPNPVWASNASMLWWTVLFYRTPRRLFPLLLLLGPLYPDPFERQFFVEQRFFILLLLGTLITLPWRNLFTPMTVYYDDTCAFCRRSMVILQKVDWRKLLTFSPSSQLDPQTLHFPALGNPNAIMAQDAHGQYAGADAIFYALLRTPALRLAGTIGLLPGVLHISRLVYTQVSRRRHCASDVCPAPLPVQQYDLRAET